MSTTTTTTPAKRTLFEIGHDLLVLDQLIEERGGDVSDPEVEAAVTALMVELADDEARKLDGWVGWIKQLEMEAAAADAEMVQWRMRAQSRERQMAWAKNILKQHILGTNRTKVQTLSGRTIAVQANGGKVPVEIDPVSADELPDRFCRVRREVDAEAVRKALEAGEVLEFARIGAKGSHLRIR